MIRLTETAAFIWNQVDTASDLASVVERLTDEYEVSREDASRDVYGFLRELYNREMIYDVPEFEGQTEEGA